MTKPDEHCDFCGKRKDQVKHLIAGIKASICDGCARISKQLLEESENRKEETIQMSDHRSPPDKPKGAA